MLSFRKKIAIAYLLLFFLAIALMLPFASYQVSHIVGKTMEDRATALIDSIRTAPSEEALINRLKNQKHQIYFRVAIINNDRQILYDSHTKRLLGPAFSQEYIVSHPEVIEAFEKGTAYNVDFSGLLEQRFYYFAKRFSFHGEPYVLRTAVPYQYVNALSRNFKLGFLGLIIIVLFTFSLITSVIINHFTGPIQRIIDALRPYHRGETDVVPEVRLPYRSEADEFALLSQTLSKLSLRVQDQIRSLKQASSEREAILSALTEGVLAVDEHLRIIYTNESAVNLLGLQALKQGEQLSVEHFPECVSLVKRCQEKSETLSELVSSQQGSGTRSLNLTATPMDNDAGAVLIVQDLTTQYKMIEMRRDFVANASHELKTPITIIRGFAETLHDNPNLPPDLMESITSRIVTNCERMAALVRDLLALADIEKLPASRLEEIDLAKLLGDCAEMVRQSFAEASISISFAHDAPVHLYGDLRLLELAFTNLIDNGAKYSEGPAHIQIDVEQDDHTVTISFSDRGIGIPEDQLDKVFQRFHRVDSIHGRSVGGSGLGLAIVSTIISKHGGTIGVTSTIGKGTTFTVKLPRRNK